MCLSSRSFSGEKLSEAVVLDRKCGFMDALHPFPSPKLTLLTPLDAAPFQSAGSLVATTQAQATGIGSVVLLYLTALLMLLALITYLIGRVRAGLLDQEVRVSDCAGGAGCMPMFNGQLLCPPLPPVLS